MRTLYIDCSMGAAGDMLSAALYELIDNKEEYINKINSIGLDNVKVSAANSVKCGITGTHMSVLVDGVEEEAGDVHHEHHHSHEHGHDYDHEHYEHEHEHEHGYHKHDDHNHEHKHGHDEHDYDHEHGHHEHDDYDYEHEHHNYEHDHHHDHDHSHSHHHSSMRDIECIIDGLRIPENVKKDVKSVYKLIAEAESKAHNVPVSEIHFHEVGTMDAIADIVGVCMLIDELKPDKIIASDINVGSGHVHCAHGILPVPAPATAYILRDVPIYSGHIKSELCTPTGAAILKHFASSFENMPVMKVEKIGYGMGKKDFEQANCVRVFLGDTKDNTEEVIELSFNVDDMTAERIAFANEMFYEAGAREVYTVAIGMKKSRPGTLISVICTEEKKEKIVESIFKHTTTLGLRETRYKRYTLDRNIVEKDTQYGKVRVKESKGYGITREKYEYDDLARIARDNNMSIEEVTAKL